MEIYRDNEAWQLLSDNSFGKDWESLHADCSWATPFQTPGFVQTWFDTYKVNYSPVIVVHRSESHVLSGLLILAASRDDDTLRVAGTHHAEYQAWLETVPESGKFIAEALKALFSSFPISRLVFRYVPHKAPIPQLLQSPFFKSRIELKRHHRQLWNFTESNTSDSLRKKSNKSRLNRLTRLGPLEFLRLRKPDEFSTALDRIIPFYDIRQGIYNDSFPFLHDKFKKDFHLSLIRKHPDLLHVTVMVIGDAPVSMHIGVTDGREVHLAIITHSPLLEHCSPGKLHLLMLGKMLLEEGKTLLDLTPGGDAWKERFANCREEVYELIVHRSPFAKIRQQGKQAVLHLAKRFLRSFNIHPNAIKAFINKLRRLRIEKIRTLLGEVGWRYHEYLLFRLQIDDCSKRFSGHIEIKRDYLADLLLFEPSESWQTKRGFLSQALARLQNGEHVYTFVKNNTLLHYGWLIEQQKQSYFSEVAQHYEYPVEGAVLYDFYTHPSARGQGLYQNTLCKMLDDVREKTSAKVVYISCLSNNQPSRHVIEKIGFNRYSSLYLHRILGFSNKGVVHG